jgi:aspartate aminotransferase
MGRLQSNASGNPAAVSQAAAVAAFEGPQDFLNEWREVFRKRRDKVVRLVREIPGLSTPVPDGAFYCFVDAKPLMGRFGGDDGKLALHLLENGVAVVAASAFGGKDGFRISFAADEAVLEEALRRIAGALA